MGEIIIVIIVPALWIFKKREHISQLLFLLLVIPDYSDHPNIGSFVSISHLMSLDPLKSLYDHLLALICFSKLI